jgi:hypothetical protein
MEIIILTKKPIPMRHQITIMIDTAIQLRQALAILRDGRIPKRHTITIMMHITLYSIYHNSFVAKNIYIVHVYKFQD